MSDFETLTAALAGRYTPVREIGAGGMGVVFLAEQHEPVHRRVAIKVLKGGLDTTEFVTRFNAERQALAVMDHPGITRVFDAGVAPNGWPYFVMEYVEGVPLTQFADERRLSVAQRVRLFAQVCRAVQHAHQKGIVHRDLKPSNILVTESSGEPQCKIIDFGIAKVMEGTSSNLTLTGVMIGTPAYMSPEQAGGTSLDIDTRTDVYALGVMLCELLSGSLPFDPKVLTPVALIAKHLTTDAPAPSALVAAGDDARQQDVAARRQTTPALLRRALSGDLDWVTAKALEKERERRYQTAIAFAEDLERYLAQQPVVASPLSGAYRARKFVRRHKASVALAATSLLLLVSFAVVVTVQAGRLARSRAIALQRQAQAEELVSFMLGDLRGRLGAIAALDVLEQVGKKAQEYFAAVPESELSNAELFRRSQALYQLGQVRVAQGNMGAAMPLYRQSLELARSLAAREPGNTEWQLGLGASHFYVGELHYRHGDLDSALAHFAPYVQLTDALVRRYPDSLHFRLESGLATSNIGSVLEAKGDVTGAREAYRATIAATEFVAQHDTGSLERQLDLANAYNTAAVAERKVGQLADAERLHRSELAVKARLVARDPANLIYQRNLATAHSYLGEILRARGEVSAALTELTASRDLFERLAAKDTANVDARRFVANANRLVGLALLDNGDLRGAQRAFAAALAKVDPQVAKTPGTAPWQHVFARTLAGASATQLSAGQPTVAAATVRRSLAVLEPLLAKRPTDQALRLSITEARLGLGDALDGARDRSGAREAWTAALSAIDSIATATRNTDQMAARAYALARMGRDAEAQRATQDVMDRGYRAVRWLAAVRRGQPAPTTAQ